MPRFVTDNPDIAASNVGDKSYRSDFSSQTSTKLADANSTRTMVTIFVESGALFVLYGAGTVQTAVQASPNYSIALSPGDYLEIPRSMYDGEITAAFAGTGMARVTELYE